MIIAINFTFFVKAKNKDKALKIFNSIKNKILEIQEVSLEPYWKEKNMFVIKAIYPLDIVDPEHAVFTTLSIVNILSNDINIQGPIVFEDGSLIFSGYCNKTTISGLDFFTFSLHKHEN